MIAWDVARRERSLSIPVLVFVEELFENARAAVTVGVDYWCYELMTDPHVCHRLQLSGNQFL